MRVHSETAWEIASKFSHVLASETRDLAAWIDKAIKDEREACAKRLDDDAAIEREAAANLERGTHESDFRYAEKHRVAAEALTEAAAAIRART